MNRILRLKLLLSGIASDGCAAPKEFKIKRRAQIVGRPTRSYPAIADGYVYVKGPRQLVCLDRRGAK